jgi:MFS family permease
MLSKMNRAPAVRAYLTLEFTLSLAFALAFTLQGLYFVLSAHLTPLQLLLVGAVLEGSAFVLEVPTGALADLYSRRLSLVLGCFFLGVAMLLVGSFPSFAIIMAAQVVSALGYTCLSGAQEAWLADELGEERLGAWLLLGGQYGRAAGIVGTLAAAGLSLLGLGVPIVVGGSCLLGLSLYLALKMPEDGFAPGPPMQGSGQGSRWTAFTGVLSAGVQAVRTSRVLGLLVFSALLYGASTEAFDRLNEFHLLRDLGLPGRLPGSVPPAFWFVALSLTGLVVGLIVTEPLRRRFSAPGGPTPARTLSVLTWLSLGCMLAFAFAPDFWWAAAALTGLGVLRGLYGPLYSAWLNLGLDPRHRATVGSLANQADALGQVTFGPLFGLAGNLWGVPAALALAALVRLPTLALLRLGGRDEPRTEGAKM